jgi:hypothetical protein
MDEEGVVRERGAEGGLKEMGEVLRERDEDGERRG